MKLKNFAMITEEKVFRTLKETPEIFCIADDFCKVFDAQMVKYTFKTERKRKYHRESRMSKAEIMVIMIPYEYRPLIFQMTDSLLYSKSIFRRTHVKLIILSALKCIYIYHAAIYHHSKCRMNQ